jgi:hypothetical protein
MNRENLTRWSLQALGFLAGAVIVAALEFILVRLAAEFLGGWTWLRGNSWFLLPGFAGIFGAKYLSAGTMAHPRRIAVTAAAAWTILVFAAFFFTRAIAAPVSPDEMLGLLRWIVLPILQAAIVWALYLWAMRKAKLRP